MKTLFVFSAIFLSLMLQAQQNSKLKLYAYFQPASVGIQKARDIDENGNRIPAKETGNTGSYLIYAVPASTARLYPVELWISGKKYGVKTKAITNTPVTYSNPSAPGNADPVLLVPKTSKKIIQLTPTDAPAGKRYPAAEKLAAENDVVFVFKQAGKFYYQPLQKLSTVDAVHLQ